MRIFVTGATGFIGSALVKELLQAGHQVLGLTRSDAGAEALIAAGAEVQRGNLDDLDSLRGGAAQVDGVIHLAFNHDFSKYLDNCETDRKAIEAMGSVLAGSDRPLIITSGTGMSQTAPGEAATEDQPPASSSLIPRAASEEAAAVAGERGVNVRVVRLPQVHDPYKQGLLTYAIAVARERGISAYIGEGRNRWPAAHVLDVATLYRLVIEKGEPGARYHAVAEEGVPMREMAEIVGEGLKVPVVSITPDEAPAHFGWLASFAAWDIPASSAKTREKLGWNPSGPTLMDDLKQKKF